MHRYQANQTVPHWFTQFKIFEQYSIKNTWISLVMVSTYCHLPFLYPHPILSLVFSVEKTVDILVVRDHMLIWTGLDHRISYWCQHLNT